MVKGKKKGLSSLKILEKITPYDIYRFYHGNFKINELTTNRHRGEKNASMVIGNKIGNELSHRDFGNYHWRGDCFNFVQQIHGNCSFEDALGIINRDFNLGLGGEVITTGRTIVTWKQPEIVAKRPPKITVVTLKGFTQEGLDYWEQYEQGEEDLKREHIFMPKQIWRNNQRMYLGNLLTFCYYFPELDLWKIYRPYAPDKEKDTPMHQWKWDTNVPFNYVENLKGITGCKSAVLGKSRKDRMVLMKALDTSCVASLQAEDPACVTDHVIEVFKDIPNKYAIMDNDEKGKSTSWWLTNKHGFKHVNVPDQYLTSNPKCTDFADMCKYYGLGKVIEHFKNKGILRIPPIF